MGEGEGGNLGSGGEAPGGICKNAPIYGLCQPDNVAPSGVEFFHSLTSNVGTLFAPLEAELRD